MRAARAPRPCRPRTRCSGATSTSRWCTRSSSPTRRTRALARAPRKSAARSTRRRRSRGARRAPAALARARPRARCGAAAARSFASSPDENFSQKVNRKMYRAGMASILSQLAREDRLKVVEEFTVDAPKTKLLAEKVKNMGLDQVLVITDGFDENLYLSSRNLTNVLVLSANEADPVALVHFRNVLLTKKAVRNSRRCSHERATQIRPGSPDEGAARTGDLGEGDVHRRAPQPVHLQGGAGRNQAPRSRPPSSCSSAARTRSSRSRASAS